MEALLHTLRNLGPMRLAIMGGVTLGMIAFFVYLTAQLGSPKLSLLYSEMDTGDASRIAAQLEQQKVLYEVRNNGTAVYVPQSDVQKLRMSMAAQGLPNGGSTGYELFDKSNNLGATNFTQNINLIRALEGELARTIKTINVVRVARVHLVLPQRQLFSRQRTEPRASIVLKMKGALRLNREQVAAIQHLTASAIPGLKPGNISIVDDQGSLLASGFEQSSSLSSLGKAEERRVAYQNKISGTIENLLEKIIGIGKVQVEVSAEIDFDLISTTEETYNPDGQVVRSTQSVDLSSSSSEQGGASEVSINSNLPDGEGNLGGSGGSSNAEARTEETVNYEISKKIITHVREAGVIERLSVAVLVDGTYTLDNNDEPVYAPRSEEDIKRLTSLVRSAVGFDEDRGDTVEVVNMRFAPIEAGPEVTIDLFFGMEKEDMLRFAEILALIIVSVLFILLIGRPLMTRALASIPSAASALSETVLLAEQAATAALARPPGMPGGEEEADEFDEMIDLDRIEGRVKASSVKKVGEIIQKHPDESLSIIRNWLYQES